MVSGKSLIQSGIKKFKKINDSGTSIDPSNLMNKPLETPIPEPLPIEQAPIPPKGTERGGGYNAEKGGYVNNQGKVFPTTNPDFIPNPNTTQIKFNKDNSVDFSPMGSTEAINLSREEYNVLQGGAGNVTNKVKDIQALQNPTPQAPNIDLLNQEQIAGQTTGVDLTGGVLGQSIQNAAGTVEKLSSFLPEFLRFGTKKDLGVQKAEQAFTDYSAVIDQQIDLFKKGLLPAATLERSFGNAQQEILNLQAQTKGQGQVDLRFWLDQGAEIEAQIAREIAILENKKLSLGFP